MKAGTAEWIGLNEDAMKKTPFVIDIRPVRSEVISSAEYLQLSKTSPGLIERAQFVPPTPGTKGFGGFFVRYSRTRHRALAASAGLI
jgi:hypothetical protein